MENERESYGPARTPISGHGGRFDAGSGRRRGGRDGVFWVRQTFNPNQSLALARNKDEKKTRTPPNRPRSTSKISLTNAMLSHVTWSETFPDLITEVLGCCCCIWCCQPVPSTASTLLNNHSIPPSAPRDLSHFHLSPHLSVASHERGLAVDRDHRRLMGSELLRMGVRNLKA